VVGFLIFDVTDDVGGSGFAHAESHVAFLPGAGGVFFGDPSGGIRFDGGDGPGERHRGGDLDKQVNMVVDAADFDRSDSVIAEDSGGEWGMCRTYGARGFCITKPNPYGIGLGLCRADSAGAGTKRDVWLVRADREYS
jgi:hypothetical protein